MTDKFSLDALAEAIGQVIDAESDNFIEFARILDLNVLNDLSGADLSGVDLSQGDFRRANFRRTVFSGANLSGADLRNANFEKANLSGADLRNANFEKANLSGADLRNAFVQGTHFGDGLGLSEQEKSFLKKSGAFFIGSRDLDFSPSSTTVSSDGEFKELKPSESRQEEVASRLSQECHFQGYSWVSKEQILSIIQRSYNSSQEAIQQHFLALLYPDRFLSVRSEDRTNPSVEGDVDIDLTNKLAESVLQLYKSSFDGLE